LLNKESTGSDIIQIIMTMKSKLIIKTFFVYMTMIHVLCASERLDVGFSNAIKAGEVEKVESYLLNNANINNRNVDDLTPLMLAVVHNKNNVVQLLLKAGADINVRNKNNDTALTLAAYSENGKVIPLLLAEYKVRGLKNNDLNTALILAAERHMPESVKYLLEAGANTGAALISATKNNNIEIVRLLLENGVDVNAKTKNGSNAYIIAKKEDYTELKNLLVEHGVDKDPRSFERGMVNFLSRLFIFYIFLAIIILLLGLAASFSGDIKNRKLNRSRFSRACFIVTGFYGLLYLLVIPVNVFYLSADNVGGLSIVAAMGMVIGLPISLLSGLFFTILTSNISDEGEQSN